MIIFFGEQYLSNCSASHHFNAAFCVERHLLKQTQPWYQSFTDTHVTGKADGFQSQACIFPMHSCLQKAGRRGLHLLFGQLEHAGKLGVRQ